VKRIIASLALCGALALLPGCATIALGVAGGIASFAGKKSAEAEWKWYQRHKRCQHLKTALYRQRCMNRLRTMQGSL